MQYTAKGKQDLASDEFPVARMSKLFAIENLTHQSKKLCGLLRNVLKQINTCTLGPIVKKIVCKRIQIISTKLTSD